MFEAKISKFHASLQTKFTKGDFYISVKITFCIINGGRVTIFLNVSAFSLSLHEYTISGKYLLYFVITFA